MQNFTQKQMLRVNGSVRSLPEYYLINLVLRLTNFWHLITIMQ